MLSSAQKARAALAKTTGLGKLAFGHDGICQIAVGDMLEIEIEDKAGDGTIRLNAALRPVGDADASVLTRVLMANFNGTGTGTGKGALAINFASGELVLGQAIEPKRHDAASFCAEVEEFTRYALFWQGHAATQRPETDGISPPDQDHGTVTLRL